MPRERYHDEVLPGDSHSPKASILSQHIMPIAMLIGIWAIVAIINMPHPPDRLIGWDNLLPELNMADNIRRAISGVWQGHQGLGHVGGHGYAATLPHSIAIFLLTLIMPQAMVRAFFHLLMLLVGGIGMYIFANTILGNIKRPQPYASLIAALFYMLNIGTIQNFYIPFEPFTVHFGLLPWLFVSLLAYLHTPSKKTLLFFLLCNIAAIPMGFVPPLFVVYTASVGVFLAGYTIAKPSFTAVRTSVMVVITICCIHAFWFLPVVHYSLTRSNEYLNSYSNTTTTPEFILKSKKYGNLANVALLKGFYFDSLDSNEVGSSFHILAPWEEHLKKPEAQAIGFGLFGIIAIGWILTLFDLPKSTIVLPITLLGLFSFAALGTDIPGLQFFTDFIQQTVPIFRQAFRIAFTKFSISLSLWYAVFLALALAKFFHAITAKRKGVSHVVQPILLSLCIGAIVLFSLPTFQGQLFYKKATITLPTAYNELFDFFQKQSPDGRIANFAQGWHTGWSIYNWGYSGSGFLWYGLRQPLLDRSFDVWSQYNETYYWEMSQALYSGNWGQFDRIIDKYNVSWILIDQNAIPFTSGKEALFEGKILEHVASSPRYQERHIFHGTDSNITYPVYLFAVNRNDANEKVSLLHNIPTVSPKVDYDDWDQVVEKYPNYITDEKEPTSIQYPFRSLFTARPNIKPQFHIAETDTSFTLTAQIHIPSRATLQIPSHDDTEPYVPATLFVQKKNNDMQLSITPILPDIAINEISMTPKAPAIRTVKTAVASHNINVDLNGETHTLPIDTEQQTSLTVMLSTRSENTLSVRAGDTQIVLTRFALPKIPEQSIPLENFARTIAVTVPKSTFQYKFDSTRDITIENMRTFICEDSKNPTQDARVDIEQLQDPHYTLVAHNDKNSCLGFYLPRLPQALGYLIRMNAQYVSGRPAQIVVDNRTTGHKDMEVYLPENKNKQTYFFIQPPQRTDGLGYSININNTSIGREMTKNTLSHFGIFPIPYRYLKALTVQTSGETATASASPPSAFTIQHPNHAYYRVRMNGLTDNPKNQTLVLSESFNPDWKAYLVNDQCQSIICRLSPYLPFLFGTELKDHILVNNWANGWRMNESTNKRINESTMTIILFFWPQLLEWVGFMLLPLPFIFLAKRDTIKP